MPSLLWVLFMWLTLEYLGLSWELKKNRLSLTPLSILINIFYKHWFGKSRWTRIGPDRIGILAHISLCNLLMTTSVFWWGVDALTNTWGGGLILIGVLLQLTENLTWSKNGFQPIFNSWSNHIQLIGVTGEIEPNEKKRLEQEIRSFSPSQILPSLLGRVLITILVISFSFANLYRQILILDKNALKDPDQNLLDYHDYASLFAYSLEITVSGSNDMSTTTGLARLIYSVHRSSNIFLFSLLIGNIVLISQEHINQRKKDLLKILGKEEDSDTNT